MDKKTALIVGGSSGIGIETAKILFNKGMNICLTYFRSEGKLKKKIREFSLDATVYKMDVKEDKSIQDGVSRILKKHKKIDLVIYCVSDPIVNKRMSELEWGDFQEHIDVQVKGFFGIVKSFLDLIKEKHKMKFIVLLTEACIGKPPSIMSHYVTAKYGLMGLVKCMASELGSSNYTFNMVSPGMVRTELTSKFPSKLVEMEVYKNPMKRIAEPDDIAKVISFLASEDSDYLNGVNILVNGGSMVI